MKGQVTVQGRKYIFGLWTIERLEKTFDAQLVEMYDTGIKDEKDNPIIASKFVDAMKENPIKFNAYLLYWGAYFAAELAEEEFNYNINHAYLWLDEIGMNSKEMNKITECFSESIKSYLPAVETKPKVKKK